MKIHIETATVEHARVIAPHLRVFGCDGVCAKPEDVERHVVDSVEAWVWLDGEEPVAIAGVLPRNLLAGSGVAWLATTPKAFHSPRIFWIASKALVAYLRHQYPRIDGVVDPRFTASRRWLKRLGFTVEETPYEIEGRAVLPFVMEQ